MPAERAHRFPAGDLLSVNRVLLSRSGCVVLCPVVGEVEVLGVRADRAAGGRASGPPPDACPVSIVVHLCSEYLCGSVGIVLWLAGCRWGCVICL